MNEKPILFNTEMVKAIFGGRKTQTRRIVKPQPNEKPFPFQTDSRFWGANRSGNWMQKCPYGQPGDLLWVREIHTWKTKAEDEHYTHWHSDGYPVEMLYGADGNYQATWRPSISMPRWASRITLRVTNVRVERVQDITEADAEAEGVTIPPMSKRTTHSDYHTARMQFMGLWDSINAKRGYSWESNPLVWVVEFEVVE